MSDKFRHKTSCVLPHILVDETFQVVVLFQHQKIAEFFDFEQSYDEEAGDAFLQHYGLQYILLWAILSCSFVSLYTFTLEKLGPEEVKYTSPLVAESHVVSFDHERMNEGL